MNSKTDLPFIVMLFPGPRYNVSSDLKERVESLSKEFRGLVFTVSNKDAVYEYANFKIYTMASRRPASWVAAIGMLFMAIREVRAVRGKENVDLVTTYDPTKTGLLGVIMKWIFKSKLMVEVNGDYAGEDNYVDMPKGLSKSLKLFMMRTVERFVLKNAGGAKLLYKEQLDYFANDVKHLEVSVFPNYVDVSRFTPRKQENEILFVGFPLYRKGVDLLVEAFKKIYSERRDWRLRILGWFPDRTILDNLILDCDGIVYQPPIDRSEMPAVLGRASILVLPSRSEAMGRILVEAAACGVARLGAAAGGIPTVITDMKDGLLFESKNIDDLKKKLLTLMDDPQLRKELAEAALVNVSEGGPYGRSQYYLKTIELYKKVINGN